MDTTPKYCLLNFITLDQLKVLIQLYAETDLLLLGVSTNFLHGNIKHINPNSIGIANVLKSNY
jgi:hypothetical protein